MNPWDADVIYDSEIVRSIVTESTDVRVEVVERVGGGFDNDVYRINNELIFRLVRRREGLDFFKYEVATFPLLPENLPLEVPRPLYQGKHKDMWPWMGYRFLAGRPVYEYANASELRAQSVESIARFLLCLRTVEVEKLHAQGVPNDWFGHMNLTTRVPLCRERVRNLVRTDVIATSPSYERIIQEVQGADAHSPRGLVHGDFKATHILFSESGPMAVIDWGDVHIGHPAVDASIAFTMFEPALRVRFQEIYGESKEFWALARFRALYHTLAILEYAFKTKQEAMLQEARRALAWTIA